MGKFYGIPIRTEWPDDESVKVRLLTHLKYIDDNKVEWEVLPGFISDGASIPGVFWSIVGQPLSPQTIEAALIHDWYCNSKEKPHKQVHQCFAEMLKALRVPFWKRKAMSFAVKTFGPKWKVKQE